MYNKNETLCTTRTILIYPNKNVSIKYGFCRYYGSTIISSHLRADFHLLVKESHFYEDHNAIR
jgi:hypothetical protein